MKLKFETPDGELFNLDVTAETCLKFWRLWRVVMFTNRRPYVNIILSHFTDEEIPGLDEIKARCKGWRIAEIHIDRDAEPTEQVVRLKKRQNQGGENGNTGSGK